MYPIGSMERSGAVVAFGSDWSVSSREPVRGDGDGDHAHGRDRRHDEAAGCPTERITLPEALAAFTINAAYTNRDEKDTGSLEVGKLANLAVLDRNLFEIPATEISETKVLRHAVRGQAGARRTGGTVMKSRRPSGRSATANGCRSSSTRPATANSCRCRSSPANRHAESPRAGSGDATMRGASASAGATSCCRPAAPRARCSHSMRPTRRPGARGGFFDLRAEAALEPAARRGDARGRRVHLRRAGPLRRPDRGLAQDRAGVRVHVGAEGRLRARRRQGRRAATSPA